MSMANAMRARVAAKKDKTEAINVRVRWVEKEKRSATKETIVANYDKLQVRQSKYGNRMPTNGMDSQSASPITSDSDGITPLNRNGVAMTGLVTYHVPVR